MLCPRNAQNMHGFDRNARYFQRAIAYRLAKANPQINIHFGPNGHLSYRQMMAVSADLSELSGEWRRNGYHLPLKQFEDAAA